MPSWFDILDWNIKGTTRDMDMKQLEESKDLVLTLIKEELKTLNNDWSKIHIGGFSQGCCLSYHLYFSLQQNIGSLVCLSGYTPLLQGQEKTVQKTKIFAYHGTHDPVVPEKVHQESAEKLFKAGHQIEYRSERHLQHSLSKKEMDLMKEFYAKYE